MLQVSKAAQRTASFMPGNPSTAVAPLSVLAPQEVIQEMLPYWKQATYLTAFHPQTPLTLRMGSSRQIDKTDQSHN